MAKQYDKEMLIADWKTGGYSQRDLAARYHISAGMVARLTKGVDKEESKQLVSSLALAQQQMAEKTAKEVSAINTLVSTITEDAKMLRTLSKNNMAGLSVKLQNHADMSVADHLMSAKAIDTTSITLGVNDRHAKPTQVSQTNQTLVNVTDDQLDAKIKAFGLEQ